jgi:hypothetical protein
MPLIPPAPETIASAGGAGSEAPSGFDFFVIPSTRRIKGYLLSRDELFQLGGIGVLTTVCFSVGGTYINRSFDIGKDLEFAQEIPSETRIRWETKEVEYWNFALIFLALGAVVFLAGGAKVISILRTSKHRAGEAQNG